MKTTLAYPLLIVCLAACTSTERPERSSFVDGVEQSLHRLGEGEISMAKSHQMTITYSLFDTLHHQAAASHTKSWIKGLDEIGILDTLLSARLSGDSITYWFTPDRQAWDFLMAEGDTSEPVFALLHLRVDTILTEDQAKAEKEFYERWSREQRQLAEKELLSYLVDNGIDTEEHLFAGVHVVVQEQGKGEIISFGDEVTMNYKASFLDGNLFDDTYAGGKPLTFRCGVQGQVIWGLSVAVRKLTKGSKATLYIPYAFGFGERGSSMGIVPPFSNLIYEVEIVDVLRP